MTIKSITSLFLFFGVFSPTPTKHVYSFRVKANGKTVRYNRLQSLPPTATTKEKAALWSLLKVLDYIKNLTTSGYKMTWTLSCEHQFITDLLKHNVSPKSDYRSLFEQAERMLAAIVQNGATINILHEDPNKVKSYLGH